MRYELSCAVKDIQKTVHDIDLVQDATLKKFTVLETEVYSIRDAKLPRVNKVVVKLSDNAKLKMPEVDQLRSEI